MVFERGVVGLTEAEFADITDMDVEELAQAVLTRHGVDRITIEGDAADVFRKEPVAAASRDDRPIGRNCCVDGDVDRRVACADDHDLSTAELVGTLVGLAVAGLARERSRILRRVWHTLEPGAGNHAAIPPCLSGRECDVPAFAAGRLDGLSILDANTKFVVAGQVVVGGPRVDVVADLPPARVVGVVIGHREVGPPGTC